MDGIFGILNEEKDKIENSCLLKLKKGRKLAEGEWRCSGLGFLKSRERKCAFSLDFRSIGLSVFDGARRKVVLRDEGNA